MTQEEPDTVILELSREDFEQLRICFKVLQDTFEINRIWDESCARLKKEERKELEKFSDKFLEWTKQK